MAKVIIGIHGRANKPEKSLLEKWWKESMSEGLYQGYGYRLRDDISFKLAYYADTYFSTPLNENEIKHPYKPAAEGSIKNYRKTMIDRIRKEVGNIIDEPLDWIGDNSRIFSLATRKILQKHLTDLSEYYTDTKRQEEILLRLQSLLFEHRNDQIFLVTHSMGTIVAYDALRQIGRSEKYKNVKIEYFVTLGSPLGLTPIKKQILDIHYNKLRTPSCVTKSWKNFSDPQDAVCLDSHLSDEYTKNSSSVVVDDILIANDYEDDPHHVFGYLRTPEFSRHLMSFV